MNCSIYLGPDVASLTETETNQSGEKTKEKLRVGLFHLRMRRTTKNFLTSLNSNLLDSWRTLISLTTFSRRENQQIPMERKERTSQTAGARLRILSFRLYLITRKETL